jgi:AcrR family transcriptional regulator
LSDRSTPQPATYDLGVSTETRRKLLDGALLALREQGVAGVSARSIAAAAGVNQALVFYHFGSVDELLSAACITLSEERIANYTQRLAEVTTLRQLLELSRQLHADETDEGNITVLAQMLAGARTNPRLAEATNQALVLWTSPVEVALERLLATSPLRDVLDVPSLARAATATLIGLELYQGVDAAGADSAFSAFEQVAVLVEIADNLGPVAKRALRTILNRQRSR